MNRLPSAKMPGPRGILSISSNVARNLHTASFPSNLMPYRWDTPQQDWNTSRWMNTLSTSPINQCLVGKKKKQKDNPNALFISFYCFPTPRTSMKYSHLERFLAFPFSTKNNPQIKNVRLVVFLLNLLKELGRVLSGQTLKRPHGGFPSAFNLKQT